MRLPVYLILLGPLIGKEKWEVGEGSWAGACTWVANQSLTESPRNRGRLSSQKGRYSPAILHGDTYSHRKHSQPYDQPQTHHHQSRKCHGSHQLWTHNCHS